jgi:transcriptional regulator with XRE-family HTH domain
MLDFTTLVRSKGLTNLKVAEACGVHETTLYRWIRQESQPDLSQIIVLRDLLGAEVEAALLEKKESDSENI